MIHLNPNQNLELTKRIQLVTRFNLLTEKYSSENYKVMNYGLGGTLQRHWDSVGNLSGNLDPIDKGISSQLSTLFQTMYSNCQNTVASEFLHL